MINHSESEKEVKVLLDDCRVLVQFLKNYWVKMDIGQDQSMYSADYLKGLADKELENLIKKARTRTEAMLGGINLIIDEEKANEELFDVNDSELQGAINLINVLGDKVDFSIANKIVLSLRGRYQALKMLKNIFEIKGIRCSKEYEYVFSTPSNVAEKIFDAVEAYAYDPTNVVKLRRINYGIRDFADVIGLEIPEEELHDGLEAEDYAKYVVRPVMGLN